jgi:hypothetical protein
VPALVDEDSEAAAQGAGVRAEIAAAVATYAAAVAAHEAADGEAPRLTHAKVAKRAAVNARTGQIVDAGFPFDDGAGVKVYSMSLHAQSRAEGVYQLHDNPAFVWPVAWPTADDAQYTSFADWSEFEPFFLAMAGALRAAVTGAKSLRESSTAAATQAELAAVEDAR